MDDKATGTEEEKEHDVTRELPQHRGLATLATVVALLVVVGLPTSAGAQRVDAERVRAAVYTGGVDLIPEVAYQRAILTVSGNGNSYRYELAAGEPLSIGLFDPAGQLLADGAYTWELQLVPTKQTADALRAEAAENDGRAFRPWSAQSGSFTIRGSAIADPAVTEEQALRRVADSAAARPGIAVASQLATADGDAAVGSRIGVEAQVNATAARRAPAASRGVLLLAANRAADDVDATSAALGRSLEPAASANQPSQSGGALAPRPRSDGSNGRPRSQ